MDIHGSTCVGIQIARKGVDRVADGQIAARVEAHIGSGNGGLRGHIARLGGHVHQLARRERAIDERGALIGRGQQLAIERCHRGTNRKARSSDDRHRIAANLVGGVHRTVARRHCDGPARRQVAINLGVTVLSRDGDATIGGVHRCSDGHACVAIDGDAAFVARDGSICNHGPLQGRNVNVIDTRHHIIDCRAGVAGDVNRAATQGCVHECLFASRDRDRIHSCDGGINGGRPAGRHRNAGSAVNNGIAGNRSGRLEVDLATRHAFHMRNAQRSGVDQIAGLGIQRDAGIRGEGCRVSNTNAIRGRATHCHGAAGRNQ